MNSYLMGVYLGRLLKINNWVIPIDLKKGKAIDLTILHKILTDECLDYLVVRNISTNKVLGDSEKITFAYPHQIYLGEKIEFRGVEEVNLQANLNMRREAPNFFFSGKRLLDFKESVWRKVDGLGILGRHAHEGDVRLYGFVSCS